MNRQQAFEAIYSKQHDVPAESLVKYRFESKEGYSLPGIASHYRFYCFVMDSIVVELPEVDGDDGDSWDACFKSALSKVKESLTAAGVKYK